MKLFYGNYFRIKLHLTYLPRFCVHIWLAKIYLVYLQLHEVYLSSGTCFFFLPPEHVRKQFRFSSAAMVEKDRSTSHKWIKEVDQNNLNFLWLSTVSVLSTLSNSPVETVLIAKKLGYWLTQNVMLFTLDVRIYKFKASSRTG